MKLDIIFQEIKRLVEYNGLNVGRILNILNLRILKILTILTNLIIVFNIYW